MICVYKKIPRLYIHYKIYDILYVKTLYYTFNKIVHGALGRHR